ncbi:MAG: 4-hydroxy-tetrahydrodipicolinate reductase [Candidatus Altiarchaeota archaeon]
MDPIRVLVLGTGRMGKQVVKRLVFEEGLECVAAVDNPESPDLGKDIGSLTGVEPIKIFVESSDLLSDVIKESKPDVAVDFTTAESCVPNLTIIAENKLNLICGTTGLKPEQRDELKKVIKKNKIGAVLSPNMSIGVNVFWKLIEQATEKLKDYDIEVIEAHHRFKKDAPSGTALKTVELVHKVLGSDSDELTAYGRRGNWVRNKGEVGVHAIRAGDIVGDHTVLFATIGERLELTHRAHSREAFVNGVIEAIRFIHSKKGVYGMHDVLGL